MKLVSFLSKMIILTTFISSLAQAEVIQRTKVPSFLRNTLESIRQTSHLALPGDSVLGFDEQVFQYQIEKTATSSWASAIQQVLLARYIDEVSVIDADKTEEALAQAIANLDYLQSGSQTAAERLEMVHGALEDNLPDDHLQLFALNSNGFGTFGEAGGLAVLDRDSGELLILLTGYSE
jgi:hypothetical protein